MLILGMIFKISMVLEVIQISMFLFRLSVTGSLPRTGFVAGMVEAINNSSACSTPTSNPPSPFAFPPMVKQNSSSSLEGSGSQRLADGNNHQMKRKLSTSSIEDQVRNWVRFSTI